MLKLSKRGAYQNTQKQNAGRAHVYMNTALMGEKKKINKLFWEVKQN